MKRAYIINVLLLVTAMAALICRAAWHKTAALAPKGSMEITIPDRHNTTSIHFVQSHQDLAIRPFPNPLTLVQD